MRKLKLLMLAFMATCGLSVNAADTVVGERFTSIDEAGHGATGVLVGFGGHLAEVMNTPVDVAVLVKVIVAFAFDDTQWFLGGRRIVKVNQGLAIDLLV